MRCVGGRHLDVKPAVVPQQLPQDVVGSDAENVPQTDADSTASQAGKPSIFGSMVSPRPGGRHRSLNAFARFGPDMRHMAHVCTCHARHMICRADMCLASRYHF
eukprot:364899-Chlamydomonas_euryale.AAC.23